MSDIATIILSLACIALGVVAGRMYTRRSSSQRLQEKELEYAIKDARDKLSTMSNADLVRSIAEYGRVEIADPKAADHPGSKGGGESR